MFGIHSSLSRHMPPPLPTSLMMAVGVRDNGEGGDDGVDIAGGQDIEGNGSRNQIDIIIFVDISSSDI
jgi:hypothetical protein